MLKLVYDKQHDRIHKVLAAKKLSLVLACAAMLLVSGTLGNDIYFDDYIHRLKLQQPHMWPNAYGTIMGLFAFGSGEAHKIQQAMEMGMVPWWCSPQLKAAFFRPVTALTHWLDYRLWPDIPALMHLQSILWLGAMVFTAALFYRKMLTPAWIAGLAALLFAIDDAHGTPAGWLANRNALVAAVFGIWALIFHHRWRRDQWKAGALLGPGFFTVGLLSAEAGLGAGAYLLAYEVCMVRATLGNKLKALLPYVLVGGLWWIFYRSMGFGTAGGGAYLDPSQNFWGYLSALVERLPALLYGQWLFPNAIIFDFIPKPAAYVVLIGIYCLLACIGVVLAPVIKKDRLARFWALGMALALLPIAATFPDNRLLIFVGFGGMGLLAQLLASWLERATWLPASRAWRWTANAVVAVLAVVHLIIAPLFLPLQSQGVARMSELILEQPLLDLSKKQSFEGKTLVFVNPPIPFAVAHVPFICSKHDLPYPASFRILATGLSSGMTITRTDGDTLEIEPEAGFITHAFDRLYRGRSHPMQAGQRVALFNMQAEVVSLTEDQRPLRVRFKFNHQLEDPSLCYFQWDGSAFVPFKPPDEGESVRLSRVAMPL